MTTTVEAKASELAGASLDWAVAKADGEKLIEVEGKHSVITGFRLNPIHVPGGYTPCTDWNQGRPPIFEQCIEPNAVRFIVTDAGAVHLYL